MAGISKRRYNNSLRTKRAEQTRRQILDAVVEQLSDESLGDLSVARIAERAGVSEPTVYRYFPNRDALWDALDVHMTERIGSPESPTDAASLSSFAERLFPLFDNERELIRASRTAPVANQFYRHSRQARQAHMMALLEELTDGLEPAEAKGVAAVLRYLNGSLAWQTMEDDFGLDGAGSGTAVSWATRTLLAEVRRMQTRCRNKKRPRVRKERQQGESDD
jgi:AcrR family transcriptional regulator